MRLLPMNFSDNGVNWDLMSSLSPQHQAANWIASCSVFLFCFFAFLSSRYCGICQVVTTVTVQNGIQNFYFHHTSARCLHHVKPTCEVNGPPAFVRLSQQLPVSGRMMEGQKWCIAQIFSLVNIYILDKDPVKPSPQSWGAGVFKDVCS